MMILAGVARRKTPRVLGALVLGAVSVGVGCGRTELLGGSSHRTAPVQTPLPGPSVARGDVLSGCSWPGKGGLDRTSTSEPTAAIGGPADAPLIVALYYQGLVTGPPSNGGLAFVLAASRDRGATWTDHLIPFGACAEKGKVDVLGNGRVSVGPDGTTYVAALAGDGVTTIRLVLVASPDGGETWTKPTFQSMKGSCHADEPSITADPTRPGRAFAVWLDACNPDHSAVAISTTSDGGRTWSPARDIPMPGYPWANWPSIVANPSVPDALRLFFSDCENRRSDEYSIVSAVSADGGASWSAPVSIAREPGQYGPTPSPALSSDGSLYVAWNTDRGTAFSRSRDNGATWSPAQVIAQGTDRISLVVNSSGSVGVTLPPNSLIISDDGGQTFGAPTQISDLASSHFMGDYAIAALADGPQFHVIYECAFEDQLSICFW